MAHFIESLLARFGVLKATVLLSLLTIFVLCAMTLLAAGLPGGQVSWFGLGLAVVIPGIITPLFAYSQFGLLARLPAVQAELSRLAATDDLTQAFNRRHFLEQAEQQRRRAALDGERFAIVLLDLDNFKQVNDRFGHPAGDEVLRAVSELFRRQILPTDVFARYGGEEFIFLLPGIGAPGAAVFAERLRCAVEQARYSLQADPQSIVRLTASLGVVIVPRGMVELEQVLHLADQALYRAKSEGKNRVVLTEEAPAVAG